MSLLLIIFWVASLLALVGIVVYARMNRNVFQVSPQDVPSDFNDFVATELTRIAEHFSHGVRRLRPHGEKMIATSGVLLRKGHNIFIERVVGRIEVKRGKAASFFLKRIAEHREALRQKGREEF